MEKVGLENYPSCFVAWKPICFIDLKVNEDVWENLYELSQVLQVLNSSPVVYAGRDL